MTRGQRVLLWIVGLPATLAGLGLFLASRECPGSFRRSPACMGAEQLILIVMLLGGGAFALFKAMSREDP